MPYRHLQPDKIVDTIAKLQRRISERFDGSSLSKVGSDLSDIAQDAAHRAEAIRRPNVGLRLIIFLLIATVIGVIFIIVRSLRLNDELLELEHFITSFEAGASSCVLIGAAIVFLITLEMRVKRSRALRAIHELRSLAHIIDMHQLTKDPERLNKRGPRTASSPERHMSPFELGRYLDYCSELLSLVSKTGALYVQDFPDPVAIEAVDRLAVLTNDLSRNIWQKIMILESLVASDTTLIVETPATESPVVEPPPTGKVTTAT